MSKFSGGVKIKNTPLNEAEIKVINQALDFYLSEVEKTTGISYKEIFVPEFVKGIESLNKKSGSKKWGLFDE